MSASRSNHTATLLPSGKVLIASGLTPNTTASPVAAAEVYDPAGGTFANTGSLAIGRGMHVYLQLLHPKGQGLAAGQQAVLGPQVGPASMAGDHRRHRHAGLLRRSRPLGLPAAPG
jgi:hypothetical protein